MLAFWKLIFLGLFTLTLIYWLLLAYCRSLQRERLENRWDATTGKDGAGKDLGPRDSFVKEGMARYEKSLRRKLLWLVYVVPVCVMTALIVVMNMQW
ncbi:hypothetical protein [Paenirhodobacter populi]|uniref:Cation/multidrug efflux pump n=1 Tax=Paenirhodobacter populi TaxID=2306993 RepID=A0A443JAL5_9RHOB|nr:hypothetical protein [Sinirhodobacter populi]RWR17582.1 hypothetical protein D2T30_18660 [Sinirhodobacter populi]RWR29027.1 hypothetical protein D2T29_15735 [Sinirhodobacter populi]